MSQMPLYGKSRQSLADDLFKKFNEVNITGKPIWISLEAPSGWGKSRVVHELYKKMAEAQKDDYWPADISDNIFGDESACINKRKLTSPKEINRAEGSLPSFMWWGINAYKRHGGSIDTLKHDLDQFKAHEIYLEEAWAQLSSTKDKVIASHVELKKAASEIANEGIVEGATKALNTLVDVTFPPLGLALTLGKWSYVKSKNKKLISDAINSPGVNRVSGNEKDLVGETISVLKRLAIPGLPLVIFVEDFHFSTPLLREFMTSLIRSNAACLFITTSWPGELNNIKDINKLFIEPYYQVRIKRVRHNDKKLPEGFSGYSSLKELERDAREKVIRQYFKNVDSDTISRLLDRYPNPLALELLCNLPKYKKLSGKELSISQEEIDKVPSTIRDLYGETWKCLSEDVREEIVLSLLAIPEELTEWHSDIVSKAIIKYRNDNEYRTEQSGISSGWVNVVSEWLRCLNESVQYDVVKEYADEILTEDEFEMFGSYLAEEIAKISFDENTSDKINLAYLTITLHKIKKIDGKYALKAVVYLQKAKGELGDYDESLKLGFYLANIFKGDHIDNESPDALWARLYFSNALAYSDKYEEAFAEFNSLLDISEEKLKRNHPVRMCARNDKAFHTYYFSGFEKANKLYCSLITDQVNDGFDNYHKQLALDNFANIHMREGNHADAMNIFNKLIPGLIKEEGANSRVTLTARLNSAVNIGYCGKERDCYKILEDIQRSQTLNLGKYDEDTFTCRCNIVFWRIEEIKKKKNKIRVNKNNADCKLNETVNYKSLGMSEVAEDYCKISESLYKDNEILLNEVHELIVIVKDLIVGIKMDIDNHLGDEHYLYGIFKDNERIFNDVIKGI